MQTQRRDHSWPACLAFAACLAVAGSAGASARTQTPPPDAPPPAPPQDAYHYDPAGRRDPFVSLVGRATETRSDTHIEGLGGIAAIDVKVSGVLESHGEYVAMVQGPAGRTWIAHVHDHLRDGTIKAITLREVVIEQDVADPLSPVKQREIRKAVGAATK